MQQYELNVGDIKEVKKKFNRGEYNKLYGEKNKEKIAEAKKLYYENNKEKIAEAKKLYNEKNREKRLEGMKLYYEKNKEKITEANKLYNEKNKEKIAEVKKLYYENNKEKLAARDKLYGEKNREKRLEGMKLYYEKNKEKIAEGMKLYYEKNKEKIAEASKLYRKNNPEKMAARDKLYRKNNRETKNKTNRRWYEKTTKVSSYDDIDISWAKMKLHRIKGSLKRRSHSVHRPLNLSVTLTAEDIISLVPKDLKCPVYKELFIFKGSSRWNLSFDRIDNNKGYHKDNVVVVSNRVNAIKQTANVKELYQVADFYYELEKKRLDK